jgi:hypothetical protein
VCVVGNEIQATYDRVWWFRFSEIEASEEEEYDVNKNYPLDPDMEHSSSPLKVNPWPCKPHPNCYTNRSDVVHCCGFYNELHRERDRQHIAHEFKTGKLNPSTWIDLTQKPKTKMPVVKLVTKK